MTAEESWQLAKRVLGVYFLVQGFLYAAEALRLVGIVIPEGSSKAGYATASLLQAAIALSAGGILLRGRMQSPASTAVPGGGAARHVALQVLGAFFLIQGAVALARPIVDVLLVETHWSLRAAGFASAAVELFAGAMLMTRPARVATALSKYDGA
jgi:hypothetical protein